MKSFLQSPMRYLFAIVAVLALQDGIASMIVYHAPERAVLNMILIALCAVVGLLDTIRLRLEQRQTRSPESEADKALLPTTEPSEKKQTIDESRLPPSPQDRNKAKSSEASVTKASRAAEQYLSDSGNEPPTRPADESAQASRAASRFLKDD